MITRNQSHDYGFKIIYAFLLNAKSEVAIDFELLVSGICEVEYSEVPLFLKKTLLNVLRHMDETIVSLTPHLKEWKFERLNIATQALLIYIYTYFIYNEDISKAIAINVAVKLSKEYLDEDEYKFINALLDEALVRA